MFDFNLLIPTQCFRAILPGTLRALFVTAIKLAEKTPSPAGEGWGEGELKTRKPVKIPLIPAFALKGERSEGSGAKLLNLMAVMPERRNYVICSAFVHVLIRSGA